MFALALWDEIVISWLCLVFRVFCFWKMRRRCHHLYTPSLVNLGLSQDTAFYSVAPLPAIPGDRLAIELPQRFLEKSLLSVPQVRFLVLLERSPGMRR